MSRTMALVPHENNLDSYMAEVNQYPLLSFDEEQALARAYRDHGDLDAAHKLVISNLRFVVKIVHQYRNYGMKMLDLVQEGNIGLMVAVKKFDPDRGYRLISYAVWWIKAQIQTFVQQSWSMVKVGMTSARRKLFFKIRSEKSKAEQLAGPGEPISRAELAETLGVSLEDFETMEVYMAGRDFSLDTKLRDDDETTHLEMVEHESPDQECLLGKAQETQAIRDGIAEVAHSCNEKEQYIIKHRLMTDDPMSLQDIGTHFGVSRERIRQIESRVVSKLQKSLKHLRNIQRV